MQEGIVDASIQGIPLHGTRTIPGHLGDRHFPKSRFGRLSASVLDSCHNSHNYRGGDMVIAERLKAIGMLSLIAAGTAFLFWHVMGSLALPFTGILIAAYYFFVYED